VIAKRMRGDNPPEGRCEVRVVPGQFQDSFGLLVVLSASRPRSNCIAWKGHEIVACAVLLRRMASLR
jgi:hypothetical protein